MLVFDLETNGLLRDLTRIHCISIYDSETDEVQSFNDEFNNQYSITEGLSRLDSADWLIGHNIVGFDIPAIQQLYGYFTPRGGIIDTLLLSRLFHPNLLDIDRKKKWEHMPLQLYGRHSLESYGYRLKTYKGDFGKTTDWSEYSEEMEEYCKQDVKVSEKLLWHFHRYVTGSS